MRPLARLNPRWMRDEHGRHVGFTFNCPHSGCQNMGGPHPIPVCTNRIEAFASGLEHNEMTGGTWETMSLAYDIRSAAPRCRFEGRIRGGWVYWIGRD